MIEPNLVNLQSLSLSGDKIKINRYLFPFFVSTEISESNIIVA